MGGNRNRNDRPTADNGRRAAVLIALLYVAVAGIWIVASGNFLKLFVEDPETQNRLETVKGPLFVVVTGGLLYVLLRAFHVLEEAYPALAK